jgi:hypothetical protein
MKDRISINTNTYLRLLFLVPPHLLVGLTGSFGVNAGPAKGFQAQQPKD